MHKKLCTFLLAALVAAPTLWAQQPAPCSDSSTCAKKKEGVVFAPRKGQWQVSLILGGNGAFYNEKLGSYLIPAYSNTGGSIGLPNGGTSNSNNLTNGNQSGYLNDYLNIGGFNDNSLLNIVGVEAKYFFNDCWDINFSAGMAIDITPKKDFIEGDYSVPDMIIPDQKYVNAETTNNWFVNVGVDRYFKTRNPRIHPYIGATVGFQMAHIETMEPYTGKMSYDEDSESEEDAVDQQVYLAPGRIGQVMGFKGALVGGIEYSLAQGLTFGIECRPVAYRYDLIQIAPRGFDNYNVSHHSIKLMEMPVVKLGFRF